MTDALGVPVHRAETIAKLAGESDIVVTTTPATAPLIEAQHLRPGITVIAMGSDAPTTTGVAPAALAAADGYFCHPPHQVPQVGALNPATKAGRIVAATHFPALVKGITHHT